MSVSAPLLANQEVAGRLVQYFGQVVTEVSRTAVENNYGRAKEFEADVEAVNLLYEVLYDHGAIRTYLEMLAARPGRAYRQAATHAPPHVRAAAVGRLQSRVPPFPGSGRVRPRESWNVVTPIVRLCR